MRCYLCHSPMQLFLTKNKYSIYRCPACGLGMTDLHASYRAFVTSHYVKGYFTGDPSYSAYDNYQEDKPFITRNIVKYLTKILQWKKNGRLLDVGCAMGYGVEMAIRAGLDAYGFDPSKYATERARTLVGSHRIKTGTIDSVSYPKASFDVITLFDVFEHLADPAGNLGKLWSYLKDGGIIVIATGDCESYLAKILKRRWTFYIPPQHLFFYSRSTLTTLLSKTGFVPVDWFRIGKWLSLRYVLHLARTTGESKIGSWLYKLIGRTSPGKLPIYLPVGDNMVVIAQKRV